MIHPTDKLQDLLELHGLSHSQLDKHLGLNWGTTHDLICFQKDLNPKIAEKLGTFFGQGQQYWLDLQDQYDKSKD